ncbi:MAG TPA: SGNH/GDSL hydrolase family protein [Acidimicrobiales bacterium]|jgi:lysophospholipase L1-like esterase|nr:SGNH/GDSL hydrolase family protein [Acidimicrobiales bacterium]
MTNRKNHDQKHRAGGRRTIGRGWAIRAGAIGMTLFAVLLGTVQAPTGAGAQATTVSPFVALDSTWSNVVASANQGKSPSIAFYGDSITAGYFASNPGTTDFVSDFRTFTSAYQAPASTGWEFASASLPVYTKVSGGWNIIPNTDAGFMGDGVGYGAVGTSGSYTFGPVEASSFNVMLNIAPVTGAFGYQIDKGPVKSIGGSGANGTKVTTVSAGTPGLHTITFTTSTAGLTGPALVVGVEPVLNTGSVVVTRGGIGGMQSSGPGAGTPSFAGYEVAETLPAPTISVFIFGSNDWYAGTPVATFQNNLVGMVNAARAAGSSPVLMVPPAPEYSTVATSVAPFTSYENAIVAVGNSMNVPVINLAQDLGPWSSTYMADPYHPNDLGYEYLAAYVFVALN